MSTVTTNFGLIKPSVNDPTDADLWGGYLNDNMDSISSLVAGLASPTFTGAPLAPTAAVATNTTQIATTAFVRANILPKIVNYTRDMSTATGSQTLTGAGFTPRLAALIMAVNGEAGEASIGWTDGGTQFCIYKNASGTNWGTDTTTCILYDISTGNNQSGSFSAFNSDGMVISWVKLGTVTGTGSFSVAYFR